MEDKDILERCHKGECICDGCERRFICWTTKRVFSDPTHQALYEAYIAEGLPHEEALKEVEEVLQRAIMEAAIREAAKHPKKPDFDKVDNKWKKDEWRDVPKFPDYGKWIRHQNDPNRIYDIMKLPVDDAKKEIKDLTKYFRSMISGKSTER